MAKHGFQLFPNVVIQVVAMKRNSQWQ
ncbi:uncharacterized protein METZ01_LOCUS225935, partial [marine metagenome]